MPHTSASTLSKSDHPSLKVSKHRFKKIIALTTALTTLAWSESGALLDENILNGLKQVQSGPQGTPGFKLWYENSRNALQTAHQSSANPTESETDLMRLYVLAHAATAKRVGLTTYDPVEVSAINGMSIDQLKAHRNHLRLKQQFFTDTATQYAAKEQSLIKEIAELQRQIDTNKKAGNNIEAATADKTRRETELGFIRAQAVFFAEKANPDVENDDAQFRAGWGRERGFGGAYVMLTEGGDESLKVEDRISDQLIPHAVYDWPVKTFATAATNGDLPTKEEMQKLFSRSGEESFNYDVLAAHRLSLIKLMNSLNGHNPFHESTKGAFIKKKVSDGSSVEDDEWVGADGYESEGSLDDGGEALPNDTSIHASVSSEAYDDLEVALRKEKNIKAQAPKSKKPTQKKVAADVPVVKNTPTVVATIQPQDLNLTKPIGQMSVPELKATADLGGNKGEKATRRLAKIHKPLPEKPKAARSPARTRDAVKSPSTFSEILQKDPFILGGNPEDPGGEWGVYQSALSKAVIAGNNGVSIFNNKTVPVNEGLKVFSYGTKLLIDGTPGVEFNPDASLLAQKRAAYGVGGIVEGSTSMAKESTWDRVNPNSQELQAVLQKESESDPKLTIGFGPVLIEQKIGIKFPERKKRKKKAHPGLLDELMNGNASTSSDKPHVSFEDEKAEKNRPGFEGITGGKVLNPVSGVTLKPQGLGAFNFEIGASASDQLNIQFGELNLSAGSSANSATAVDESKSETKKPRRPRAKDIKKEKERARKAAKLGRK